MAKQITSFSHLDFSFHSCFVPRSRRNDRRDTTASTDRVRRAIWVGSACNLLMMIVLMQSLWRCSGRCTEHVFDGRGRRCCALCPPVASPRAKPSVVHSFDWRRNREGFQCTALGCDRQDRLWICSHGCVSVFDTNGKLLLSSARWKSRIA